MSEAKTDKGKDKAASRGKHARWGFWSLIALFGILPALLIHSFLSVSEGQLWVLGQSAGEGGTARLMAAVLGAMQPIFYLLPFALTQRLNTGLGLSFGGLIASVGILTLPSLSAVAMVGGTDPKPALLGLALLVLLELNFLLWLRFLFNWLSRPGTYLLFAGFWAVSGFIDYVALYIVPYQDLGALKSLVLLRWLMPQAGTGFTLLDGVLTGQAPWLESFQPTLFQIPFLLALVLFTEGLNKRS